MTLQSGLLVCIAIISLVSAIDWWSHSEYATGWAFFFFAIGDAALAVEFAKGSPFGG